MPGTGLYLHVPFCSHRCGYCDFATWEGRDHLRGRYVDAIRREGLRALSERSWQPFTTVFIGGGTPTMLRGGMWQDFVALVEELAPNAVEGTLEANPESLAPEHLDGLPTWTRTRISLGVQDLNEAGRRFLERQHAVDDVFRSVGLVRERGFELNLDLIIGWNGQSPESLNSTLDQILEIRPEHLSVYMLTVEPGTKLGSAVATGSIPEPDGDLQAELYSLTRERLLPAYEQYEISNFAVKPSRRCEHNLLYWEGADYLGLGVSAASHFGGRRWNNVRNLDQYLSLVEADQSPETNIEVLTPDERGWERLWLGLRLTDGVLPPPGLSHAAIESQLERAFRFGLVHWHGDRLRLTEDGLLLSNEVFLDLVAV